MLDGNIEKRGILSESMFMIFLNLIKAKSLHMGCMILAKIKDGLESG